MKYKIQWTSKVNGATGFGTGRFSKEDAEAIAKDMNNSPDQVFQAVEQNKIIEQIENKVLRRCLYKRHQLWRLVER